MQHLKYFQRKCFVLAIVALLASLAPAAAQAAGPCEVSPPSYWGQQFVVDSSFTHPECGAWGYTGNTSRASAYCSYAQEALMNSYTGTFGSVYQDITVSSDPWRTYSVGASIYLEAPPNASWFDYLQIGISYANNPDYEVERVAQIHLSYASNYHSCATLNFPVSGNYRGQRIRLKFYSVLYTPNEKIHIGDVTFWGTP